MIEDRDVIRNEILRQVQRRGPDKTICPSEVARRPESSQDDAWRELMPAVRSVGCDLESEGKIQILQKGQVVPDPQNARGPIRYRMAAP